MVALICILVVALICILLLLRRIGMKRAVMQDEGVKDIAVIQVVSVIQVARALHGRVSLGTQRLPSRSLASRHMACAWPLDWQSGRVKRASRGGGGREMVPRLPCGRVCSTPTCVLGSRWRWRELLMMLLIMLRMRLRYQITPHPFPPVGRSVLVGGAGVRTSPAGGIELALGHAARV